MVAHFADLSPSAIVRQQGFFAFAIPLQADLELSLAEVDTPRVTYLETYILFFILKLQLFLGLPRDALPLFEKLQSWENLIHCYRLTEQVRMIVPRVKIAGT